MSYLRRHDMIERLSSYRTPCMLAPQHWQVRRERRPCRLSPRDKSVSACLRRRDFTFHSRNAYHIIQAICYKQQPPPPQQLPRELATNAPGHTVVTTRTHRESSDFKQALPMVGVDAENSDAPSQCFYTFCHVDALSKCCPGRVWKRLLHCCLPEVR